MSKEIKQSFIIQVSNERAMKAMKLLEEKRIPYYYICDDGAVECGTKGTKDVWGEGKLRFVVDVCERDGSSDKCFIATIDYLKRSEDSCIVCLRIPDSPDEFDELPDIMDILEFKTFEPKSMDREKELCSKCGKPFLSQGYLGGKGEIAGQVVHTTKTVKGLFGSPDMEVSDTKCYLNEEQWNKLKNHPELKPEEPIEIPMYDDKMLCTAKCECPYCHSENYKQVDSEYPIMECNDCHKRFWSD